MLLLEPPLALPLDPLLPQPLLVESLSNNKEPLLFNIKDTCHQELHTQCHNNITNHLSSNKLLLLQLLPLKWVTKLLKSHPISESLLFSWL
jgi:hypothetical protein